MKRYSATKVNGGMVVTLDRKGKYRASTPEEIKRALTELHYFSPTAEVLIGKTWRKLGGVGRGQYKRKPSRRPYSEPAPVKPPSLFLRILKKLRLYKDPLEVLIYRPEKE